MNPDPAPQTPTPSLPIIRQEKINLCCFRIEYFILLDLLQPSLGQYGCAYIMYRSPVYDSADIDRFTSPGLNFE